MNSYTVIKPKQKYMTLAEIKEKYGKRGVVAYSCKVVNAVPQGGYVIAVQNDGCKNTAELRAYHRQLVKTHPDKLPIYYFCLDDITADVNDAIAPAAFVEPIKEKHDPILEALMNTPDKILASALSTTMER